MAIETFRDLVGWQKGMALAREVYRVTAAMPESERFGLTSQMRRAASSIPLNIAEGFAKWTRPEYVRGLRIAAGSLAELTTAYELAVSLGLLADNPQLAQLLAEEDRILAALIRKLPLKRPAQNSGKPAK
jgi:four helix bundle protein